MTYRNSNQLRSRSAGQIGSSPLRRARPRRGSVLILVVAVLVLLALIGTAYIATSRSDRTASAASESAASIDKLASGVVESLANRIAAERIETDPFAGPVIRSIATAYFAYNSPTSVFRTDGLQQLSARAPFAPTAANTLQPGARPRWPFIAAPLSATGTDPSFFANPAPNAPFSSATPGPGTSLINRARWGLDEIERRGVSTNNTIAAIAAVTLTGDGQTYPAFFTTTDGQTGYVIAADADGDGIADSGLVPLGGLPNPDYAGITFYYGLRVVDHNSALNVNTAWTNGDDLLAAGTSNTAVRNNRLFPAAIGLKETLTPRDFGSTIKLDETRFDSTTSGFTFTAYRAGRLGDANALQNRAIPVADLDPADNHRPNPVRRVDFAFTTRHELLDTQLGRRLDFPGVHAPPTGNQNYARFTPFTLAEQGQWAEGFVLATRDPVDNYATALSKRTPLEQLLPNSMYRLADSPNGTTFTQVIRSRPYIPSEIGFRQITPTASDWFNDNFNYDVAGGTDPLTVLNLRPLVVASNPVSQAVRFKPLPVEAVLPTDPGTGPRFDVMHPYVRIWRDPTSSPAVPASDRIGYAPGEVVYYPVTGRCYIQAGLTPVAANVLPTASPWRLHTGPVVPTKVDLNTAPFGDLWRAFYLTMAADTINPADRLNTVSPFGPALAQNLATIYRGMDFNNLGVAAHTLVPASHPADPSLNDVGQHPQRMFRSNLKDPVGNTFLPPDQMVLLRAAQAAVNAEYLRSLGTINPSAGTVLRDDVPARTIALSATVNGVATPVAATVFAAPRGLYITEVYVNTETREVEIPAGSGTFVRNPGGYIAVELYNPYPYAINLNGWRLQVVDRTAANAVGSGRTVTDLFTFDGTVSVPAGGTVLLENFDATGTGAGPGTPSGAYAPVPAAYRPGGSGLPAVGASGGIYVPGLERVYLTSGPAVARGELVITRPRSGGIVLGVFVGLPATGSAASTSDAVPVDSIDLSGVAMGPADITDPAAQSYAYHYARRTQGWHFVYPGRYTADTASPAALVRQQGLRVYVRNGISDPVDDGVWANPPVGLGDPLNSETSATYTGDGDNIPGTFPIQIANIGFGGPNAAISDAASGNNNRFPFGGFLRNLDVLQVPFISPVRIHAPGNPLVQYDVISLTHDAAFAEDTATDNNAEENIGRFAPIVLPAPAGAPSKARPIATIDEKSSSWQRLRYGWAADILDHVTVRPSTRLSLPGTAVRTKQGPVGTSEPYTVASYPENTADLRPQPVSPKPTTFDAPSPATAYDVGEQGLVNINTAPLPVLAAVPWVRNASPVVERAVNVNIARSIIAHREKNGPFESIFDLNAVRILDNSGAESAVSFRVGAGGLAFTPPRDPPLANAGNTPVFDASFVANLTNDNGDFSPLGDSGNAPFGPRAVPDPAFPGQRGNRNTDNSAYVVNNPNFLRNPPGDYESQFLMLTAVSNLITTRSDTFTAYIVIEGWRDAGTERASRVLQRRYAFIMDRTGVAAGLPRTLIDTTTPADSAVVNPSLAGDRVINTNVRVSRIPTR